jgi:hypothetical protein
MRRIARAVQPGGAPDQRSRSVGDAVQLHAMIDETEAEALGNSLLQFLELVVDEFDHIAGLDIDQMIVVSSDAAS